MSFLTLLTDILFVGHSLVGPSLPPMVEAGLERQGYNLEVSAQVINGAPLKYSWNNSSEGERGDARTILPKGETSVLVLTEATPIAAQVEWNESAAYVAKFAQLAWDARPDTQVYIYETWPGLNSGTGVVLEGDAGASTAWRERLTAELPMWEAITAKANAARPEAAPLVRVIPAGQAIGWLADAISAGEVPGIDRIDALFDDDIHPDDRALYFLAMVQVAVISNKDPNGLPAKLTRHWLSRAGIITDAQAASFQRIAWAAVTAYQSEDVARIEALERAEKAVTAGVETSASVAVPPVADAVPRQVTAKMPEMGPEVADGGMVNNREDGTLAGPGVEVSIVVPPREVTNPRLALGLAAVVDWSVQQPFLDLMKTARPWIGHLAGQWGGVDYESLQDAGKLDANGWPIALPPNVTGVSTLLLTDLPEDAGKVAGRYVLNHEGKGKLTMGGRAEVVETSLGRVVFDYTPGPGSVILTLTAIDATDPVRAISVVREDQVTARDGGALFNPDWLRRIRGAKGIRFMDWMAVNNSTLAKLQDRPKLADFSWAVNGVPVEVMVALANELRADAWFTMPHLAEDALVRAYAVAVRDGLAPGLMAQVEYSNEMWNWQFAQAAWADEQCRARWQAKDCWVQFYGMRAAEVVDIWADVFGDAAKDRLTRVIATQTAWMGLETEILDAPLAVAEGRKPPVQSFEAYAVTGYFAAGLGTDEKASLVQGWLSESRRFAQSQADQQGLTAPARDDFIARHRFDLATDHAAAELENGFVTGQSSDTLMALLTEVLPYHAKIAKGRGLALMMYEGGTHVVANGRLLDEDEVTSFFHHLNYAPQMGALYEHLQEGWAALTSAPFNAFVDVYAPSKWGSWGALRHLGDDNPRWQALAHGCKKC